MTPVDGSGAGSTSAIPPIGQPLPLVHEVLPAGARIWGAGRPAYPDEPPSPEAVEEGAREWRALGVDLVVSLIEDWEVPRRAPGLFEGLARSGIEVARFPVPDFGAPADRAAFATLLNRMRERMAAGAGLLVHCNAGLGRTAVVLASVLKDHGLDEDAVDTIRRIYRPNAMLDARQEAFVRGLPAGPNGHGRARGW